MKKTVCSAAVLTLAIGATAACGGSDSGGGGSSATTIEAIDGIRYVFYGMADAKIGVARLDHR